MDALLCLIVAGLILKLTCPRLLVYFRCTVAVMSYEGVAADGRRIEWVPEEEEFRLFRGRAPRPVVVQSAERRARRFAARLAEEPAVIENGVREIRWTLDAGPHSEMPVLRKSGAVETGTAARDGTPAP